MALLLTQDVFHFHDHMSIRDHVASHRIYKPRLAAYLSSVVTSHSLTLKQYVVPLLATHFMS